MTSSPYSDFEALRGTVRGVLQSPLGLKWTSLGLGMIRCYLDPEHRFRLNVWHSDLAVPGVSAVHDHPWGFRSYVIAGRFKNTIYEPVDQSHHMALRFDWDEFSINDPVGPRGVGGEMFLAPQPAWHLRPGEVYEQMAETIHRSDFHDCTVTLNDRRRDLPERTARIFWPSGGRWVDAQPGKPSYAAVVKYTQAALDRWF